MRECATEWQRKHLRLDVTHPTIQSMATIVERWAGRYARGEAVNSLLVLAGRTGTGKTHCAKNVASWARKARGSSTLMMWPEVVDGFKEGQYGSINDMFDMGLLILDDVGAEHDPSKNGQDKLCQVLSRREKKHTIITTNIGPRDWLRVFDARITDRLFRNSVHVDLTRVDSYAITKANNRTEDK